MAERYIQDREQERLDRERGSEWDRGRGEWRGAETGRGQSAYEGRNLGPSQGGYSGREGRYGEQRRYGEEQRYGAEEGRLGYYEDRGGTEGRYSGGWGSRSRGESGYGGIQPWEREADYGPGLGYEREAARFRGQGLDREYEGYGRGFGGREQREWQSAPRGSQYAEGGSGPSSYSGAGSYHGGEGTYTGGMAQYGEQGRYAGRGPKGYKRSDDRIKEEVCERLTQDPYVDASEIEVQVKDGEVTLTGSVDNRDMKHRAENDVENLSGVREIHNQIRIQISATAGQGTSPQTPTTQTASAHAGKR